MLAVEDYTRLAPVTADVRLSYASGPEHFGDLYLPQGIGPHPVLIVMHGGCWRDQYRLDPMGQLCQAFRNEGLAVWNLEYRRLGSGGGWPATFSDVAAGADYLSIMAGRYSLDLARVVALGHSAGGHLALWLAGRRNLSPASPVFSDQPLPLRGVVSLAGIANLVEGVERNICRGQCQALMGGLPDEVPERYQQGSPHWLLPLGVPQWHFVGRADPVVPADYVQGFVALAERHDEAHFVLLPEAGHFELVVPSTEAFSAVRQAVLTLAR
jgi:pimeloyl-ACP methyl ester carboxylesterase